MTVMTATSTDPDQLSVNAIRALAMDAVQAANSGHPGTPMAMAPVAYTLWQKFLRFDPELPIWANRDRFVLSAGHASTLLFALLYLSGVKAVNAEYETIGEPAVSLEDLRRFRQLDSKAPGHPEYRWTSGVETTTGPLGTGIATSVGMAMAEKWLAATYNRPGFQLFDYNVYALAGDGDMMEGIGQEAASLAGHLRLDNLCWIYDNNRITIEGSTSLAFSDDVATRFIGYGWNVTRVGDANDMEMLARAFNVFLQENGRPTLIIVDSHIGYGAPTKQGTSAAHGEPLGADELRAAKEFFGWPTEPSFYPDPKGLATRDSNGRVLNAVAGRVPWLLGGSSDLAPSTKTLLKGMPSFEPGSYEGRTLHFGVREHAAAAVANGLALSKLRAFQAGFLIFHDFQRGAVRLSSLMELPVIHIYTHDSIGVGEDGPTHQPVEHLASLRAMPGMIDIRPADANEVAETWRVLMPMRHEPVALVLSRQALPTLDRSRYASAAGLARGAYVLADPPDGDPEVILIATGSELSLAVAAYEELTAEGVRCRVVSLPSWELFAHQSKEYQETVLPPAVTARVAIEQASAFGWERYVGTEGAIVAMSTFGESAPLKALQTHFGFTPEAVAQTARN